MCVQWELRGSCTAPTSCWCCRGNASSHTSAAACAFGAVAAGRRSRSHGWSPGARQPPCRARRPRTRRSAAPRSTGPSSAATRPASARSSPWKDPRSWFRMLDPLITTMIADSTHGISWDFYLRPGQAQRASAEDVDPLEGPSDVVMHPRSPVQRFVPCPRRPVRSKFCIWQQQSNLIH